MEESTESEFFADFGDAITERELDSLLSQARADDDRLVRLLVKQFRMLRRASTWLVSDLDEAKSLETLRAGESTRLIRFLIANGIRGG